MRKKKEKTQDHGLFISFKSQVRYLWKLQSIQDSPEAKAHNDLYRDIEGTIEVITRVFSVLKESKEKARKFFDPDEITKDYISEIKDLAAKERSTPTS